MTLLKPFTDKTARRWMTAAGLALTLCGAGYAATTDIANAPLFTSSADLVKPNVMFILDDSGSMDNAYLPDEAAFSGSGTQYGELSSQCNGVAYNPAISYSLPVNATGATLAAGDMSSFTPNPITQTSTPRPLSALASTPASAAGSLNVTVTSGSRLSSWYPVGNVVTVYQNGDSSRYLTGFVTSFNTTSGLLVINLTGGEVVGGGPGMTNPIVGKGRTAFATYYRYTGTQKKLSYTYTSTGVITTTTFYRECNSTVGSTPGSAVFVPVSVTSLSAEAQNYANWMQYYRTRILMMKSAMSLAFKNIDNRFRVGYSTISETTAVEGSEFVNIRDFDATQKAKVYAAFNAATPGGWTPLRGSLSKAGQYYANKARSQTMDPMQYSCQRNFTILSTDGYWNTPYESTTAPKFGPYALDNTTNVGQQDGSGTLRPMLDGNSVSTTTTQTWTSTAATITTGITPKTTITTSTRGTTTFTPMTGYSQYVYTLSVKRGISSIVSAKNSPYTVTVTSANHGFANGDSITVSGGTLAGYTGTFTISGVTSNSFQYNPGTNPSGTAGDQTSAIAAGAPAGAQSCPAGQGLVVRQEQRWDSLSVSTSTRVSTTTTLSTVTAYTTTSVATPFQRVIKVTDNVTTSDITTQGVFSSTNSTTATTSTSPSVTATSSTTAAGTGTFTAPTNFGAPTTIAGCTASLPSPNPSTATTVGVSTSPTTTTTGPTITGPTTTAGTTTLSVGTTTTTVSPVVSVSSSVSTGGVLDSLADIAMYYYQTDLRTTALGNCTGALGVDVCDNRVKGSVSDARHSYGDAAAWQHMTTFTLGLGVNGILNYDPNYINQLSGDFFDILNGSKNWPAPNPVSDQTPAPTNIDDLWHAAVNGRGQYFSAGDPSSLSTSLDSTLNSIKAVTGSASAASTSSLQPVQGDNDIYLAKFTTAKWTGDIEAYRIDPSTGAISSTTTWKASALLDATAATARTIYYPSPSGTSLHTFTYANLTADSYNGNFTNFCSKTGASGAAAPAQCSTLSGADLTAANSGANLVSYLRGDQTLAYYRSRDHVLGDIINASPLYIGKPSFKYPVAEHNYPGFAATSRTAVILAAANDGMLHAFDRITGNELWAYIPSFVMGNLYKLADTAYGSNHSFYVDGSPQMGDIWDGTNWKTIVVGGLNAGGRGYYALDVTDPTAPKLLWEFSATDLGLTFGNPIITKRSDAAGTWVVVFASGYNNVSSGDGNGHLYVLDAKTGSQLLKIDTFTSGSTPAGTSGTPSGLAKINAFVNSELDNKALRFYGGDLLGNLWRFDIDNLVAPNQQALRLAQLKLANGTAQPITTKPALAQVLYNNVTYPVVYAGTGRYIGTTDLSNTTTQSVYAIKDPVTNTPYGDIRASSSMVVQTITAAGSTALGTRSIAVNPVDWSIKSGWRADFPAAGERVNINPQLVLDTLYVGTNIPSTDTCTIGGSSFLYQFDITTGGVAAGQDNLATFVGDVLIQGITTVQLAGSDSSGSGSIVTILTRSDGTLETEVQAAPASSNNLRRTSWRELVN